MSKLNSNNIQVDITDNISILDSNVIGASVKKRGNDISVSIRFNPYKNSLDLISGLPHQNITGYYIPVFNYNSGELINGGIWIKNEGKISYFGKVSTSSHIAHFEYVAQ